MLINRAEIIFYVIYVNFIIFLSIFLGIFSSFELDFPTVLVMLLTSITGLILVSFISRYIVIIFQLNPTIKYGHLQTNNPLRIFKHTDVYSKVIFHQYIPWYKRNRHEGAYRKFKESEHYSKDITFTYEDTILQFTKNLKSIEYKECQVKNYYFTLKELLKNYEEYHLEDVISKDELKLKASNRENFKFFVQLNYIENGIHEKKDVIVGLDNFNNLYPYDTKVFSNYSFKWDKLFILILNMLLFFAIVTEFDFDSYYIFFIMKALQYNLFGYIVLFLILKKYLYKSYNA